MIPFPTGKEEETLHKSGFAYIIGADEVGRGAFAGPVVAAATVLPLSFPRMDEIHDSKLLSSKKRAELASVIKEHAIAFGIAEVPVSYINDCGIKRAADKAFQDAVADVFKKLASVSVFLLTDGFLIPGITTIPLSQQRGIIKGDQKCICIAAASIIAKVYRDTLMIELHGKYPQYEFSRHKGYGTKGHQKALKEYGLCPEHRTSFHLDHFLLK